MLTPPVPPPTTRYLECLEKANLMRLLTFIKKILYDNIIRKNQLILLEYHQENPFILLKSIKTNIVKSRLEERLTIKPDQKIPEAKAIFEDLIVVPTDMDLVIIEKVLQIVEIFERLCECLYHIFYPIRMTFMTIKFQ